MTGPDSSEFQQWATGTALMTGGTLVVSFDALLIHLSGDVSGPEVVFWRMSFLAGTIWLGQLLLAYWSELSLMGAIRKMRDDIVMAGPSSALVIVSYPAPVTMFVFAMRMTSTVNCLVLTGSSPLWSAILSRVILGDELPLHTVIAVALGMACMSPIFLCSTQADREGATFAGDILSLFIGISLALYFIAVRLASRRNGGKSLVPMLPFGCCIGATATVVLGGARPLSVGSEDMLWIWLMGGVMVPVAISAFTLAAAMISAPECSLIQLLEMVLAPVWTWLFLGEVPRWSSVLAGVGLAAVLLLHTLYVYSLGRPQRGAATGPDALKEPLTQPRQHFDAL